MNSNRFPIFLTSALLAFAPVGLGVAQAATPAATPAVPAPAAPQTTAPAAAPGVTPGITPGIAKVAVAPHPELSARPEHHAKKAALHQVKKTTGEKDKPAPIVKADAHVDAVSAIPASTAQATH